MDTKGFNTPQEGWTDNFRPCVENVLWRSITIEIDENLTCSKRIGDKILRIVIIFLFIVAQNIKAEAQIRMKARGAI